eukprot:356225-Chlamydomonas_euryale.AAC.19
MVRRSSAILASEQLGREESGRVRQVVSMQCIQQSRWACVTGLITCTINKMNTVLNAGIHAPWNLHSVDIAVQTHGPLSCLTLLKMMIIPQVSGKGSPDGIKTTGSASGVGFHGQDITVTVKAIPSHWDTLINCKN